jgi:hypothetical protein
VKKKKKEKMLFGKRILNRNLAFVPLILLLQFFGFYLDRPNRKKFLQLIHSASVLAVLCFLSPYVGQSIKDIDSGGIVVSTITYINTRCIHFALIIIYIRNTLLERKSLWGVFKCFDNIDLRLKSSFNVEIKDDDSKWFMRVMLSLLIISAFGSFAFEYFSSAKAFNVGQFLHAMLVFILSVKISFYCMLCASIKLRFKAMIKYLKDAKSSQTTTTTLFVAKTTAKYVATKSFVNVSQVKEISLIYDETLKIILLLNESFSTLLSFAFGKEGGRGLK